jgi:cell division GTPase FtsZ
MGIFLTLLKYGLGLLPSVVLGVQTIAGDKASGADKLKMASDALAVALQGATGVITDPTQAALVQGAATTVASVLSAFGAINAAVTHTKATGEYQAATAAAAANSAIVATPSA